MLDQMKRSWGVSEQKIVAARQKWRCAKCDEMLDSTYQLDHIVPLWEGGSDDHVNNANALCANCHATKTQHEAILRRKVKLAKARLEIETAIRNAPASEKIENLPKLIHKIESIADPNPFLHFSYVKPAYPCRGVVRSV